MQKNKKLLILKGDTLGQLNRVERYIVGKNGVLRGSTNDEQMHKKQSPKATPKSSKYVKNNKTSYQNDEVRVGDPRCATGRSEMPLDDPRCDSCGILAGCNCHDGSIWDLC